MHGILSGQMGRAAWISWMKSDPVMKEYISDSLALGRSDAFLLRAFISTHDLTKFQGFELGNDSSLPCITFVLGGLYKWACLAKKREKKGDSEAVKRWNENILRGLRYPFFLVLNFEHMINNADLLTEDQK